MKRNDWLFAAAGVLLLLAALLLIGDADDDAALPGRERPADAEVIELPQTVEDAPVTTVELPPPENDRDDEDEPTP